MKPGDMQEELKNNIDSSLMWLLTPMSIKRYIDRILLKRQNGQPISFTDIFGHLVGETLLKDVSLIYSTPKNLFFLIPISQILFSKYLVTFLLQSTSSSEVSL